MMIIAIIFYAISQDTDQKPIEEKWEDKIMYDDYPMGIPGDWDD